MAAVAFSLGAGGLQSGCSLVSQLTCAGKFWVRIPGAPCQQPPRPSWVSAVAIELVRFAERGPRLQRVTVQGQDGVR